MNRILIVNKKSGLTNSDIIKDIKIRLNIKKLCLVNGIDVFCSGLIVIAENRAIKTIPILKELRSKYQVEFSFGKKSNTWDSLGSSIESSIIPVITRNKIELLISKFGKQYLQNYPKKLVIKVSNNSIQYCNINKTPAIITISNISLIKFSKKGGTLEVECNNDCNLRSLVVSLFDKVKVDVIVSKILRTNYGNMIISRKNIVFITTELLWKIFSIVSTSFYKI